MLFAPLPIVRTRKKQELFPKNNSYFVLCLMMVLDFKILLTLFIGENIRVHSPLSLFFSPKLRPRKIRFFNGI